MTARQFFIALTSLLLVACARVEMETEYSVAPGFKLVTVDANVSRTRSTIADDGTFSWSTGDVISVMATDGNFYDFTLESGSSFSGLIPETAEITTVAVYPVVAENGTNSGVYADGVLNFTLKAEINALEGCSNIPMVASFEAGSESINFKQVGAAFKFHVVGAPTDFYAAVTFTGTNPVGTFPIDPTQAGEAALTGAAAEAPVTVTAHYTAESVPADGAYFYIPVAVGPYTALNVKLYEMVDDAESVFFEEDRVRKSGDYTVARGDIFIMNDIEVEISMRIERVHPFFSDAKVTFAGNGAATAGYAFYVDDADPVIVADPALTEYNVGATYTADGEIDFTVPGAFALGSTHTVAVAPVGADGIVESLKSDAVSFTTGIAEQLTGPNTNQGPYQVTVWMHPADMPAIPTFTTQAEIYDYWAPTVAGNPADDSERAFAIQLLASDDPNATPVYDLVTVDRQMLTGSIFTASNAIGRKSNTNLHGPDRVSLGWLDPNTTYYFRARGIAPVEVSCLGGNETKTVSTEAGESAWSQLVPVTTGSKHVAEADEILYQGFDDIMLAADFVNMAPALVPYFNNPATDRASSLSMTAESYKPVIDAADGHVSWPYPGFASTEYPWTFHHYAETNSVSNWGLVTDNVFNEKAGTLSGWSLVNDLVFAGYGNIRIGDANQNEANGIETPVIDSPLLSDVPQTCTVTLRVCPTGKNLNNNMGTAVRVDYLVPDGEGGYRVVFGNNLVVAHTRYPIQAYNNKNYFSVYAYRDATTTVKLAKGYKLRIVTASGAESKRLVIDDIKVTYTPDAPYDGGIDGDFYNTEISEPDGTDYDVFKLNGEFPISYWFHIPKEFESMEQYQRMKDAGFNVIIPYTHSTYTVEDNLRILDTYCKPLGFKYLAKINRAGWGWAPATQAARFADIDQYIDHPNYIGQYCGDEQPKDEVTGLKVWHQAYYERYKDTYPDKFVYNNLFPTYAKPTQLGYSTYEEYVDDWLSIPSLRTISFDHYPITLKNKKFSIQVSYYLNLDMVRSKTLAKRIHFWMIGHGGYVGNTPYEVTEKMMRWNAWSAIAMGSKGYQYFCYWTPDGTGWGSDQYMIDNVTGEPTERYYFAKQLNADMVPFGQKLLQCHADGGIMVPTDQYAMYEPRLSYGALTSVTGDPSITGCFRAPDGSYKVMVTHLTPTEDGSTTTTVTLHFDETVTSVTTTYTKDGSTATVSVTGGEVTLTFPEGEAYLVEWK